MKIGFGAPHSGAWATPENLGTFATKAEQAGYDSLWTFQRLLVPVGSSMDPGYQCVLDPVAVLGYLAARTSRIRLGVAVVNLPFVSPTVLAKHVFVCGDEEYVIVLDLKQDRYFTLDAARTEAVKNVGIEELAEKLAEHRAHIEAQGTLSERRRRNLMSEVLAIATNRMRRELEQAIADDDQVRELLDRVVSRELDPASAAATILERERERVRS